MTDTHYIDHETLRKIAPEYDERMFVECVVFQLPDERQHGFSTADYRALRIALNRIIMEGPNDYSNALCYNLWESTMLDREAVVNLTESICGTCSPVASNMPYWWGEGQRARIVLAKIMVYAIEHRLCQSGFGVYERYEAARLCRDFKIPVEIRTHTANIRALRFIKELDGMSGVLNKIVTDDGAAYSEFRIPDRERNIPSLHTTNAFPEGITPETTVLITCLDGSCYLDKAKAFQWDKACGDRNRIIAVTCVN